MLKDIDSIEIHDAILHVFDMDRGIAILSQKEFNFSDPSVKTYLLKQIMRIEDDIRAHAGIFDEDSVFLKALREYTSMKSSLTEFSIAIVNQFSDLLKTAASKSFDILFVDYSISQSDRIAMIFLECEYAYTHEITTEGAVLETSIVSHHAVLPAITKKINAFAVIDQGTEDISFVDHMAWKEKEENIISDSILQCSSSKSKEEVMKEINTITMDVAEEYEESPALYMSKVKNYVREHADESDTLDPMELAEEIYHDAPQMKQAFQQKAEDKELPKEVTVPGVYINKAKKQKIRTDTGIELTIPAEYYENKDYIEFVHHGDGTLTIELKNIGTITNKA